MPNGKTRSVDGLNSVPDIRAFMGRHRIRVKDVARAYGCSHGMISHLLGGRRNPRPATLSRLRRAVTSVFLCSARRDHASCSEDGAGNDES